MCGNSKGLSTIAHAVIAKSTQSENAPSSIPACGVDDCCKSEHLIDTEVSKEKDDIKVLKTTDKIIDKKDTGVTKERDDIEVLKTADKIIEKKDIEVSKEKGDIKVLKTADRIIDKIAENDSRNAVSFKGETPVVSEDSFCELETSSETSVNADRMFEHSGNCGPPDHVPLKEYDTQLFNFIESSHSRTAPEHGDGSNNVVSSKSHKVSHSHPCNETSEENESDALSYQEVESNKETEDKDNALHKLIDLEVRNDKNEPSKILCSVQMLEEDSPEISGKSADVEMRNDETESSGKSADVKVHREQTELNEESSDQTENVVGKQMQNVQNERANSGDIEMQDSFDQASIGMHKDKPDSDHTELKEVSSGGDGSVGLNEADDQVDNADEDHRYGQSKPSMKPNEANNRHFVRIRVRNSSELKEVPSDSMKSNDRALGEDNVPKTDASIEENGIISVEKETSVTEADHAVDNRGGNKFRTYLTWGLTNMLFRSVCSLN
jgi:hypothetical protein